MSFFLSPLGNEIDDPYFGSPLRSMQHMNSMMNSVFSNAFGGMLQSPLGLPQITNSSAGMLSPFGFPTFERMFGGFDMVPDGNGHSFSSSTVMTFTNGPDGRPQVYQASSSTRTAPGGVRETKKSVCDSRSGIKKLAIGHHIGERGHVMEREQNFISGEQEERQDFINISEDEAEEFNREFEEKARRGVAAIRNRIEDAPRTHLNNEYEGRDSFRGASMGRHNRRLALPSSTSGSNYERSFGERRSQKSLPSVRTAILHKERPKKREHEPEVSRSHKTLKPAQVEDDEKNAK